MGRNISLSPSSIREIRSLWKKGNGMKISEIVSELKVPYTTVYSHTRLRDRGFKTPVEYSNFLAKEKGDSSAKERRINLLRERGLDETSYLAQLA